LPKFFKQSKFTSFTRKLNRWGFIRVTRGPQTGSYFHKLFQRDHPELCLQMRCQNARLPSHEGVAAASSTTTTTTSSMTRALFSRPDIHNDELSRYQPTLSTTQGSQQQLNSLSFNSGIHNGNLPSSLMRLGISSSLTGMTNPNSVLSNSVALMQMKIQLQQLQQQQQQKRLQQQQHQVHNEMLRRAIASQASANATRAQFMMGNTTNINMMMPPPMTAHSKEGLKFLQMLGLQKSQASSMSAQPLMQAMQNSLLQASQTKNDQLLRSNSSSSSLATATNNLLLSTPPQPNIDPDQAIKRASAA
jgi:HSF-type DNA-binding